MMISVLFSAIISFTATATGVEKGTPIEFIFAGPDTDRAYESMFLLEESVAAFCQRVEASVKPGTSVSPKTCHLWPSGCRVSFEPATDTFVKEEHAPGEARSVPIYTGGTRLANNVVEANTNMPCAVYATYSLAQAPIVHHDPVDQGMAYGRFTAAVKLEKGARYTFKMTIDEATRPSHLDLTAEKGKLPELLKTLKQASAKGEVEAKVSFSDQLSVAESIAIANGLSVIDSPRVKLNGANGFFYRAFLPLEKWRDRTERLQQPFELTLQPDGSDTLTFIDEDWSVEGLDPKLTARTISFESVTNHPLTSTCFIYASKTQTISRLERAMKKFPSDQILNWYIFPTD